jgi:hypothetical protein
MRPIRVAIFMTDFGGVTPLEIGGRGFTLAVERSIVMTPYL